MDTATPKSFQSIPPYWFAVGITAIVSWLLTLWCVYADGQYGIALFILLPIFIGAAPVLIYNRLEAITWGRAKSVAFASLGIYTLGLLVFALEGLICIFMVAPFGALLTWISAAIAHSFTVRKTGSSTNLILLLAFAVPLMSFGEKYLGEPALTSVITSVEIDASPETVWQNVVEFPQLPEPRELVFKTGIAYPINAKIEGVGVGAVRHCNFSTGSFVEPVTVWDEPNLLAFNVEECPAPMRELSFWDVDAPHLHDYFVSQRGQFQLTRLPGNRTLLEGTTWYFHDIRPAWYWRWWSNAIIHAIHNRVLSHIKTVSEKPISQ